MEVVQAGPNRIRFPSSTCLKLFTIHSYVYWVGCVCNAGIVELPLTIHRLIIYRYDVISKACRLVMQWQPYSSCKYWNFHIFPGETDLYLFQHQHEVTIHKICLMEQEPEAILMENLGSKPWLRGMSVTVAVCVIYDTYGVLVVCQKSTTDVCIVYRVATGLKLHFAKWSPCNNDTYTLVRMRSPYYFHRGWSVNALGKDRHDLPYAVRWGWQMQPTSATGQRPKILFETILLSDAGGRLELWVPRKRRPSSNHVPLNESFECSICFHHPASYNELLNTRVWVRACECLGYCHQECMNRWVLYAHRKDYYWRFNMNIWLLTWCKHSRGFQCRNCYHIYSHTIGPLRPMHQIIQATKALLGCGLFCAYQIVLVVLLLFTLLQAKYPVLQSLVMTFGKAVDAHYLNVIQSFDQPHWMLHDIIRFIDAGLLMYTVFELAEYICPVLWLLVLMTIPVPYQLTFLVIVEIVLLAPHLLAIHRVRFVDYDKATRKAKRRPIIRSQSLTNLPICP